MVYNFINTNNLNLGIAKWKIDHENWDKDFHNRFYADLYEMRKSGFSIEYWGLLVDKLAVWRATRGSSKAEIFEKGMTKLPLMMQCFNKIIQNNQGIEPDLSTAQWIEIQPLFKVAFSIKRTHYKSPVFASKLCHFILPNTFMVTDNAVIDAADDPDEYGDYWEDCKESWIDCTNKDELIKILSAEIGDDLITTYPFSTKITELCIIGSN